MKAYTLTLEEKLRISQLVRERDRAQNKLDQEEEIIKDKARKEWKIGHDINSLAPDAIVFDNSYTVLLHEPKTRA